MKTAEVRQMCLELVRQVEAADLPALLGILAEAQAVCMGRLQQRERYLDVDQAAERALTSADRIRRWARRRSSASWARWINRQHLLVSEVDFDLWLSSARGRRAVISPRKRAAEPSRVAGVDETGASTRLVRSK